MKQVNVHPDVFAIASKLYVKLRRTSGRVIDVYYLVENLEYARYIIDIALAANDQELSTNASRLKLMLFPVLEKIDEHSSLASQSDYDASEPDVSEEEIYKAQVSHHYIGALR